MQNIDIPTLPGTTKKNGNLRRAVLVTTAHRGIFFGYLIGKVDKAKIAIARARNVVYFDAATKGFLGLASNGPTHGCRIGPPAAERSDIFDITGVFGVTNEAAQAFESAPWSR